MSSLKTEWIVITGAPRAGKTTTVCAFKDHGYLTESESYDACIKDKSAPVDNRVLQRNLIEIERLRQNTRPHDLPVFLDRAMADRVAFDRFFGFDDKESLSLASQFKYKTVIIMSPLPIKKKVYSRWTDEDRARMDDLIESAYRELGYNPIRIPIDTIENRVSMIRKYTF